MAALELAGRTGGLPFVGVGWYRLDFEVPAFDRSKKATLVFDGAMSHARVYINGIDAGYWPYGYNTFYLDVTPYLNAGGKNIMAVRLENDVESSRWYPGAGLYRNVHLIVNEDVHIPMWGTQLSTPVVKNDFARVRLNTSLVMPEGKSSSSYRIVTEKKNADGSVDCKGEKQLNDYEGQPFSQVFVVSKQEL